MALSKELKRIKQLYGEETMKLCRQYFPTILEEEGMLLNILTTNFANNARTLAQDLIEYGMEKDFVDTIEAQYDKIISTRDKEKIDTGKDPFKLLDDAGYVLFEINNEIELQSFRKYYAEDELLCTFVDDERLKRCKCFWAIREDVNSIKREDFKKPEREDKYGTSVLAIQFTKQGRCNVSIKSRYNHTVDNPDATFKNDLDAFVPGLEESFRKYLLEIYGLHLDSNSVVEELFIPGYECAQDGKFYKVNLYANDAAYCPGNVVLGPNRVEVISDPEQQVLIDNYVLDLKNKTLKVHIPEGCMPYDVEEDAFVDGFKNMTKIERVKDKKTNSTKFIIKTSDGKYPIYLTVDEFNNIIEYENKNLEKIGWGFMMANRSLLKISLPNVKEVDDRFIFINNELKEIDMTKLEKAGDSFLHYNRELREVSFPNLSEIGMDFLVCNNRLQKLSLPKLTKCPSAFMSANNALTELDLPNVEEVEDYFMQQNMRLTKINMPKVKNIGFGFLSRNVMLDKIELPNVETIESNFLSANKGLSKISFPKLKRVRANFLMANNNLEEVDLPSLESYGEGFLARSRFKNISLKESTNIASEDLAKLDIKNAIKEKEVGEVYRHFNEVFEEFEEDR